jgi:hypothetical protein
MRAGARFHALLFGYGGQASAVARSIFANVHQRSRTTAMHANDAAAAPYPVQSSSGQHGDAGRNGSRPCNDRKASGAGEISQCDCLTRVPVLRVVDLMQPNAEMKALFPCVGPMMDSDPRLCPVSLRIRAYLKRLCLLCSTSLSLTLASRI